MRRTRDGLGSTTTNVRRADKDDYESLCIMERYFCKAENPPKGVLEAYIPLVKDVTEFQYKRFKVYFHRNGMEFEDVYNLALCYAVSFLGLYSLQKSPEKMSSFIVRYQKVNKTDSLPPEEVVFKKNCSDMRDFIKQKVLQLSLDTKKVERKVFLGEEKTYYFKTKNRVDIEKESLPYIENGYKGIVKIRQQEYLKVKKELRTKRSEFESNDWTYFSYTVKPQRPCSFEEQSNFENESETFLESCGIVEKEDASEYVEKFLSLSDVEKVNVLKKFITRRKDKELVEVAKDMLDIFKR